MMATPPMVLIRESFSDAILSLAINDGCESRKPAETSTPTKVKLHVLSARKCEKFQVRERETISWL